MEGSHHEFEENGEKFIIRSDKKYKVKEVEVDNKKKIRLIETDPKVMLCTLQKLITKHLTTKDKPKSEE